MTQTNSIRTAFFYEGSNISQVARDFRVDRKTVRKYISQDDWNEVPPVVAAKPLHPKLDPYKTQIDEWLLADKQAKKKQRHTAKRVYDRLCEVHGDNFDCSYRTVASVSVKWLPSCLEAQQGAKSVVHWSSTVVRTPGERVLDQGRSPSRAFG